MEVKEREAMGDVILETPALNIDASTAAPATAQVKATLDLLVSGLCGL